MQQFSPQQHTAAPAAISSPQPSIQQPLLLSSPLFAEGFHSSTAVRSAAAASSSSPPDETFQAAVAAESLPSSATAAVAAAAEAQQQILLAALAAELRSAVDRWCPVGRAPRTGAAAPPPAAAACPVLRSATVSGAPAAVRLPHGREDEGEEDQLLQQHKPRSALELLAAAGGRPVAAALEASERVKGDSSSNSKGGGHVTWGWWHCSSAAPGGGRQEFFLTPAAAGLLLPAASETGISPLCCLWDKPPPRCLYTSVAVRVIMKSAVRLPTHLYREEAAIEEEDAAGLLGCLEEEGLSLGVEADVRGRRELVAALSYEEGGTCTRGVSSSPLTGSRESSWEAEATAAASPARQQTRPDKSSRGRAGGHGSSHSASSSSSSREDDASSHRWGEWPLSVPSSEDVQEVLTSSEEKAAAGGYLESGRAKCSAAAHTKASGRASLKGAASALSEISNFHTASAAAAEGRSSSQRRVGGSATSGATAAHAAAGAAAGGRRANVSCCWETPDTFFENTPLLEPEAQVPGGTARAAAAAAVAAPAGASAAGDPKLPLSPPPALAPLPALGAAAANGQQRLPCATAVEPPTAVGSALRGNNLKLSSVTTVSAAAAETGAGTVEGAAAFAAAAAAAVANGGSTSLASLLQGGLHTEKPAGSCRTAAAAAEGAREQQGREGDPYSDDCSGGAAAAAAATTGGGATGGGGSRGGEGSLLRRNHGRVAAAAGGSGVLLQERSTAAELSVNSSSSDQPLSTGSASFSGEEETPQYPQQAGETQALLLRKKNSAFPGERRGGHDKAAAAAANNSNDNGGASDITHHHHHPEIRNGGDGGGQWKAYDDGVRGEKAVREAADGGQDSERSAGKEITYTTATSSSGFSGSAHAAAGAAAAPAAEWVGASCRSSRSRSRASAEGGRHQEEGKGGEGEAGDGRSAENMQGKWRSSSEARSVVNRKLLQVTRSSSSSGLSGAVQTPRGSPRQTFSSRRSGGCSARATSSKSHCVSTRITQRRRLCVMATDDEKKDRTDLLPSPTRSTLFCAQATSPSRGAVGPSSPSPPPSRHAVDAGACGGVSADIHPAAAATTAAALGAAVSDEVARSQRKTGVHAATGDNVSSSQEIPASCLREASSEEARVEETAVFSEVPVKARSVAVAQNGQDRRLPAAGEIRPMMRLAAAGDLCRAASAPETAAESTRHSGRCLGSEKERWAAGTAEHVLLRNPAEAAAAAATKAAQAAAACRRRVFDLFSPVAPDGPADTSRPTTAATADDVHQFVYVWLEGCCRRLQAVAAESAADVALAKASENRQLRQQVSTASSSSSSSSPGGEEAAVTHVQGDEAEVLHAFLLSSKRQVKEELKAYDAAFLRRYGRVPGRPEKEPLHPLYSHYQLLRRLLLRIGKSVEEADPQTRARAYPAAVAAALRSCSDSGSGNITVRGEKENLRKKVADEKACDAQVTAEAAPLTAGDIPPPPSSAARDSITAARACTAPVAVDVGGENRRVAVGSKSLQSSGDDRARQDGHLLVRQKEQHCSPKAVAGTERADGAAALPVVEWSPGGVDGGSKGGGVFDGIREKHDACRGVQNKSNNSTIGRHLAADATAVVGVRKPFLATATGSDGGGEGERKEVAEMSEPKGNLFAPENWWQRSSDLRGRHNNRNAHPRRERTDKETDQPPLLSAASAAAVAGCNPASGRSVPSSPSVHLADSSSATDVSVQAHTFKSLTMSAETEISLGASPGLPVHSSGLVSESHVGRDNNCTMRQAVCQEFRSDKARVTVMRPVHQDRIQVIAGQSFSNVCAARRRDSEHCSVENSCVQDACEHHASGHHGKNKCQQGNKCDSPRSRDCRMRDASCSSQQYQQQSAGAPAQLNDIGVGNADAKELTVDVRSQLYRQDEVAAGKIHPYAGSEETSVCQPMKILTSGMTAPEVRKPQRRTELMRQSAGVHSQMESPHKAGLPFLANVATEYQQRLLRLQQEKRMLRTKLLAYQAEFTAETGRVVQLYKDIAPIEREYRRYKEVKQEIAMLIDKQCDSLFSTNESEARHQALEEDGIPSEKFEKGRPEVCAS